MLFDLGCGEKPYKDYLLQFADIYIGVDWGGTLHDLRADIIADLNKPLPIENGKADTVVSFSVLEHLSEPQIMLNEAFRILKPGGVMVFQVPWQWLIHEAPFDFFRYTPHGLRYMLNKAGFEDINVDAECGLFTNMALKFNYFTIRFIRGPRLTRLFIRAFLFPIWTMGQVFGHFLDKLDRNWEAETQGYFIVAKKK